MPVDDPRSREAPRTAAQARAAAEAQRRARRAGHDERLSEHFGETIPGRVTIASTWLATGLLAALSVAALVEPDVLAVYFVATVAMFGCGSLILLGDIVAAIVRSTTKAIGLGGLFFAVDCAPRGVMYSLNGALVAAVVVAVATAVIGLSTPELASGTLAPLLQMALTGLWTVRHGMFPEREQEPTGEL